jgi:hypothetical protein
MWAVYPNPMDAEGNKIEGCYFTQERDGKRGL